MTAASRSPRIEAWDARADRYADQADQMEPVLQTATKAILDAVQAGPGVRLLDLGCGPGHSTAAAHARGADAFGVDASSAMVAAAKRRFPGVRFILGDMLAPPPGPWDAIVCRFAAHHAGSAWLAAAFGVLRPGGRIAIAETSPTPGVRMDESDGKKQPSEWRRLFEEAGFADVTATPCDITVPPGSVVHDGIDQGWPSTSIIAGKRPASNSLGGIGG